MSLFDENKVMSYQLEGWKDSIDVRLERVGQMDGTDLWAIREKGCCLNKKGEWEIEPIPSSRNAAFYKRCRWKSAEDALKFWSTGHKSRFEHYRVHSGEKFPSPLPTAPEIKPEYKANFLWPHEEGSIEEAGYEFANARTAEYQKQWWKILLERAAQQGENPNLKT